MLSRREFCIAAVAAGSSAAFSASASETWPTRIVRLVVPFPPGGANDVIGRLIADKLSKLLGQTVVIENKPGAGGTIGAAQVANAAADGYSLVIGYIGNLGFAKWIYPDLSYDPVRSFVPISNLATTPTILVVNPSVPVHSVRELIAYTKANPDRMAYSSGGNGTAAHINMAYLCHATGMKMVHVPYRGTAGSITDLIAGQVQVTFAAWPGMAGFVREGRLRALAVSTRERMPFAPELPTVQEAGVPGFEANSWYGILAPANTPREIVKKVDVEIEKIMKAPDVLDRLAIDGTYADYMDTDRFKAFIGTEVARWETVIKAAGIGRSG